MPALKISTFNVRGINDNKKRSDLFDWLRKRNIDICLLQETHCSKELENKWGCEWGYTAFWSSHSGRSRGVAILFKNSFQYCLHNKYEDCEGRYIMLDITINNSRLSIINIYGPNTDDPDFFNLLGTKINMWPNNAIIMAGDYNVVQDYTMDTLNINQRNNPKAHVKVNELKETLDLYDPWRQQHPITKMFTWHNSQNKHSRLDYFLLSSDLANSIDAAIIKPGYKSDHSIVEINLTLSNHQRGPGIWKFNNSLLQDNTFIEETKRCIHDTILKYLSSNARNNDPQFNEYVISNQLLFEIVKMEIRGKTIAYATAKKKEFEKAERDLDKKIDELHKIHVEHPSEMNYANFTKAQNELEVYRNKKIDGLVVRAKAKWNLQGEKNSKYFLNLEKKHYTEKTTSKVINDEGIEVTNLPDIINEQKKFYENLYTSNMPTLDQESENIFFPNNDNFRKLSNEESMNMEGNISVDECFNVLKKMKINKSPGSDGYTVEFYLHFWNDLKYIMVRAFQENFEKEFMSNSQKLGLITCLPKPGKPKEYLKNWRPISLLNVDYKILSGVIAQRIKKNLDPLISNCQKGFVTGRFIGECTRLISDLLHYAKKNKVKGILLLLDFEKAFDSLEWTFIERTLKHFNFGKDMLKWVKIFYTDIESCVVNNGHCSERFKLGRGVRQGDPLSPYLFILAAEILARAIFNSNSIKGITLENSEFLISQLADDTALILEENELSFKKCLELLSKFTEISGLKINYSKTIAITFGIDHDLNYNLDIGQEIKWQKGGKFTLLGINYDLDQEDITSVNYEIKLKDFEKTLRDWNKRSLTIYGKICIIKSLALPKLVHLFTSLPNPPEHFFKKIEAEVFRFIWNGKTEKIKRTTVYNCFEYGGFRLPNIKHFCMAQKLIWIKKMLDDNNNAKWKTLFLLNIENLGSNYIWLSRDKNAIFKKHLNEFWQDVYDAWATLTNPNIENDPRKQPLFHNSLIKINHQSIFYKEWYLSGVLFVNDVIDQNGDFLKWEAFSNKYNIRNQPFRYMAVIHAIPRNWKKRIKELGNNLNQVVYEPIQRIKNIKKPSRYFYTQNLEKITTKPYNSWNKWSESINEVITEDEWQLLYKNLYHTIKETKLKYFQMQIYHRILPTNKWLYLCNMTATKSCTFCNIYEETIEHLLYECVFSKNIWLQLFEWLESIRINLAIPSKKQILLGDGHSQTYLEHLKILTKYFIYQCKINAKVPFFNALLNTIKMNLSIEKCNMSDELFIDKWNREILEFFGL